MGKRELLLVDGLGNIALGLLLLIVPIRLAGWLGLADVGGRFYPSLFGAVLLGIGVALLLELPRRSKLRGLGLGGALIINTCFGLALAGWLLFGELGLPTHGAVILWGFVGILLGLSAVELASERLRES